MNPLELARTLSRRADPDGRILTLALDVSKAGVPPQARVFLKDRVAEALRSDGRPAPAQAFLKKLERRVAAYVERELPAGADGLFLAAGPDFWEAVPLSLPLPNLVHVGTRPFVAPLLDVAERGAPAAVAVVDSRSAELFGVSLGEERPLDRLQAVAPESNPERRARGRQGDSNRDRFRDSAEEAVQALVREAARRLGRLQPEAAFVRVFFAGASDLHPTFVAQLPASLAGAVTFLKRGRPTAARIAREVEALALLRAREAVDVFRTRRAAGEAALGVRDTLEALRAGQLRRVFLRPNEPLPGVECGGCGSAFADPADACPYCGGGLRPAPLAQVVVEHVLAHSGTELLFVRGPAPWLDALGGLAGVRGAALGASRRVSRSAAAARR